MAGMKGSLKAYEERDHEKERELHTMEKKVMNYMSVDVLRETLNNKEDQLNRIEILNVDNEKLLQKFEDELERKTIKIDQLEFENGSKTEEIHQMKYKLNEYQKKYEKYSVFEKKINLLIQENEQLKRAIESGKTRLGTSTLEDKDDYEDRIAELEQQIIILKDLVNKLRAELDNWRKRYFEMKEKAEFWEVQRDEAVEKFTSLEYRYEDKCKEAEEKTVTISQLSAKIYVLLTGMRLMHNEIERLQL